MYKKEPLPHRSVTPADQVTLLEESICGIPPTIITIDITGSTPEINPEFRWFMASIRAKMPEVKCQGSLT